MGRTLHYTIAKDDCRPNRSTDAERITTSENGLCEPFV